MNSDSYTAFILVIFFRKQTEKNTTEYNRLFHAIQFNFIHRKTLPCCIIRGYFTANELWIVVLQGNFYFGVYYIYNSCGKSTFIAKKDTSILSQERFPDAARPA
jgi:hypothetical protein